MRGGRLSCAAAGPVGVGGRGVRRNKSVMRVGKCVMRHMNIDAARKECGAA